MKSSRQGGNDSPSKQCRTLRRRPTPTHPAHYRSRTGRAIRRRIKQSSMRCLRHGQAKLHAFPGAEPTVTMAEMAKASDATSVLLRSTEVQLVTAAMKIAVARHSRPMRTQRRRRRGSRIALSAGSFERGVSRTESGVANCQRKAAAQTIAIRHTPYRHGDDSPGGTFQANRRIAGGSNVESPNTGRSAEPGLAGSSFHEAVPSVHRRLWRPSDLWLIRGS